MLLMEYIAVLMAVLLVCLIFMAGFVCGNIKRIKDGGMTRRELNDAIATVLMNDKKRAYTVRW